MKIISPLHLARLHQPHGIWLLLFPSWWGLALASSGFPPFSLLFLFFIGAVLMRSAGCIYNDIIDRDFDIHVKRTSTRPLITGNISFKEAMIFLVLLLGGAAFILFNLPLSAVVTGLIALGLIFIYPWMKRLTYWPQLFLGLTFNIGIIMGYLSLASSFSLVPFLFYGGAILWTLGYDTIYALQDLKDDLVIGVKSSTIVVNSFLKLFLSMTYGGALFFWAWGGRDAHFKETYWFFLILITLQFTWQILSLNKESSYNCLKRFQSNSTIGILLFLGIVFSRLID